MTNRQQRAILCPICRRLINAGSSRCPHCDTAHPGAWWKNNRLVRGFGDPQSFIRGIVVVNGVMFLLSLLFSPRGGALSINPLDFLAPDNRSLMLLGATGTIPINQLHRWWSLISANYLHGSILHIIFNMIALNQVGPLVISEYGGYRMLALYTGSGVIGFFVSYLAGVPLTIGASAAVCGLIGSALFFGKHRGGSYGQAVYSQLSGWVVGLFIFGFLVPGINNWGHGGGLLGGALLGYLLGYQEQGRETALHKLLAAGCV
ncbi:MAG: rhomboid family intramembrane serine protease, partial [Desulfobulbaceae bacterium]|nr:rhomboid family intramembrane serine protease [Desulfobulbaceae bacterium]